MTDPAAQKSAVGNDGNQPPKLTRQDIKDSKYAWIACFCAVINQIFICGFLQIFGVYFVELVRDFKSSQSEAAWLGSLAYGVMKLFGPVTGFFVVRFTNRTAMIIGCLICSMSLLVSSFVKNLSILYFTFSIVYGMGSSLVINCAMVLANEYFDRHLGPATGLVCAGSSIGTLILAPSSQAMIDNFGWRVAFRVLVGFFICVALLNNFIKPMPKEEQITNGKSHSRFWKKNTKEMNFLKNKAFLLWTLSTTFAMFGYYIPFVHLVAYGIDRGIPAVKSSYFIMTLGGATTIGRLVSGKIVQSGYLNCLHLSQCCMIATGTMYMILPAISSFGALMGFVVLLGLADGCYVVLLPILTCSLVGMSNAILAWGILVCICSLTFTIGPPVAGALYDLNGNYDTSFHVAGIPVICGALCLFFIPWAQRQSRISKTVAIPCSQESDEGSVNRTITQDLSESTIFVDTLREGGYILPPADVVTSDVSNYLVSHFQNNPDVNLSTSLGDHRVQSRSSVAFKSESLPIPLNLMCGPDGMPISIPSLIMNHNTTRATIVRHSLTSCRTPPISIKSGIQSEQYMAKYLDANRGLKFGHKLETSTARNSDAEMDCNYEGKPSRSGTAENSASDSSSKMYSDVAAVDSASVATGSLNLGATKFSPSETFESVSLTSDPLVMASTASGRDADEADMFTHIFKEDKSETRI